jgi:hypothetical protein
MSALLLLVAGAGSVVGLCIGVVYHDSILGTLRRLKRRRVPLLPIGHPYRDPTAVGVVVAQAIEHGAAMPPAKALYWEERSLEGADAKATRDVMSMPRGGYHDIVGADATLGPMRPASTPTRPTCPVCSYVAAPELATIGDVMRGRRTALCTADQHRDACAELFPKARPWTKPDGVSSEEKAEWLETLSWMQQNVLSTLLHNQRPHLHLSCSSCGHRWTAPVSAEDITLRR